MVDERKREIWFGLTVLLIPALVLLLVEIAARTMLPDNRVTDFDWRGLRLAAAATPEDTPFLFRPNSSYAHLSFNSLGLRGPELETSPSPATIRLAFLGDSTVFNAVYHEDQTLAAQVTARLREEYPACSFDYATFAGPAYSLGFLSEHWQALRPRVSPDITVVLAGSPYEAIGRQSGEPNQDYDFVEGTVRAHLATIDLFERVVRRVSLTRLLQDGAEAAPGFYQHVDQSLDRMHRDLAALTPDETVIVIGHRARVRTGTSGGVLSGTTRHFRNATGVKEPQSVVDLVEHTVSRMREAAETRGWFFTDPLAKIPPNGVNFRDALHLSDQGIARLAALLVEDIRISLPDCTVEVGS